MTRKKKDRDFNITAFNVVQKATGQVQPRVETILDGTEIVLKSGKNPNAVALGRLGGLKGGKARAAKLTAEQRSEIAKKAAAKRWHKT